MPSTTYTSGTDWFGMGVSSSCDLRSERLRGSLRRFICLLGTSLMLAGCQTPVEPGGVLLRIEPVETEYSPGDTVRATFRNVGTVPVRLSACNSRLQKYQSGRWVPVQADDPGPSVNCPDVLSTQPVGATSTYVVGVLPALLAPGIHRYRIGGVMPDADGSPASAIPESARLSSPFLVSD